MFIDIHSHLILFPTCPRPSDGKQPYPTPEVMLEYYDGIGVDKSIMLPVVSPDSNYRCQSNDEIFEIHRRYPDRFIPFCNMDPRNMRNTPDAKMEYVMKYYRDKGCRGVGELTANMAMDDPRVHNLFRAAECAGLPVTIHIGTQIGGMYGLVDEAGLPKLEEVLQKFPDLKIFGHSQPFWAEMSQNPTRAERNGYPKGKVIEGRVAELMRKYPNLYGDLSAGSGCNALMRDEEYGIRFLNEFQDRLMFGIDNYSTPDDPPGLMVYLKKLLADKKISQELFDKVTHGNAIRILDL